MNEKHATQEGVILIFEGETPVAMIRKNGTIKHYKLSEMNFGDHTDLWDAAAPKANEPRT